jgi:hypothetical protein
MSETFKYVFVTWCGEGVAGQSKALFANHSRDFEDYLKKNNFAFAAQINARNETDLEEANIVKALNKTSTFIRAATTQERRAQPQSTLMDKRTNYWNKQTEIDQKFKTDMDQHKKENESRYGRSREEEQSRLANQSNKMYHRRPIHLILHIFIYSLFFHFPPFLSPTVCRNRNSGANNEHMKLKRRMKATRACGTLVLSNSVRPFTKTTNQKAPAPLLV